MGEDVVGTVADTRRELTGTVARFRAAGLDADPVVFGSRRRPEAVLMAYEQFEALMEIAEDVAIAQRVAERDGEDDGTRFTLAEVAADLGVDLHDLDLADVVIG